jgi:alpha-tubulin suppressor-like RCC1 family protein
VGLKCNGTVVSVGDNEEEQGDVGGLSDIVQVAAGQQHTVGLKSNGTVVAVGDDYYGQCNVDSWSNIIQVAAGNLRTLGLSSNGTVVAVGLDSEMVGSAMSLPGRISSRWPQVAITRWD